MAELLGVKKLVCSQKSGICRMAFPYEKYDTPLFFYEKENGVLVTKNEIKGQLLKKRKVGRLRNQNGFNTYINMKHVVKEEAVYYSIFSDNNGYFIRKSKEKELTLSNENIYRDKKDKGFIASCSSARKFSVPTWMDLKLRGNAGKPYLVCTLSFKDRRFMKLTPVETLEGISSECEAAKPFGGLSYFHYAVKPVVFQYHSKHEDSMMDHQYRIPIAFYRAMGFQKGDDIHLEFLEDGSLVMTPKINCEICGDPIDSYWDKSPSIHVTKEIHKRLPKVRKEMKKHSELPHRERLLLSKETQKEVLERLKKIDSVFEALL